MASSGRNSPEYGGVRETANVLTDPSLIGDLTAMEVINQTGIVKTLKNRFDKQSPYTFVGSDILVAVNPKGTSEAWPSGAQEKYKHATYYDEARLALADPALSLGSNQTPAHVLEMANRAFYAAQFERKKQIILTRGVSGSGKSAAAQQLVQHFIYLAKDAGAQRNIDYFNGVQAIHGILSAFTHVANTSDDNLSSSRAHMAVDILYAKANMGLRGVHFNLAFLDQHRFFRGDPQSRHFHIFYALLAGASANERTQWRLPSAGTQLSSQVNKFTLLKTGCAVETFEADEKALQHLRQLTASVGISSTTFAEMLKIVAAILHLGNVDFITPRVKSNSSGAAEVKNMEALQHAAELLGVDPANLVEGLTQRLSIISGDVFGTVQSVGETKSTLHRLMSLLYTLVINHLVKECNLHCSPDKAEKSRHDLSCTVLDFVPFQTSSIQQNLEQMCMQFTSELLHNVTHKYHVTEQVQMKRAAGISIEVSEFVSSREDRLSFYSAKEGLFDVINKYATTSSFDNEQRFSVKQTMDEQFKRTPFYAQTDGTMTFGIRHYDTDVQNYEAFTLVEEDRNAASEHYIHLLFTGSSGGSTADATTNNFLRTLFAEQCIGSRRHPRDNTQFIEIQPRVFHSGKTSTARAERMGSMTYLRAYVNWLDDVTKFWQGRLWQVICLRPHLEPLQGVNKAVPMGKGAVSLVSLNKETSGPVASDGPIEASLTDLLTQVKQLDLVVIARAQQNNRQWCFTLDQVAARYSGIHLPTRPDVPLTGSEVTTSLVHYLKDIGCGGELAIQKESYFFFSYRIWSHLETLRALAHLSFDETSTMSDDVRASTFSSTMQRQSSQRGDSLVLGDGAKHGAPDLTLTNDGGLTLARKTPLQPLTDEPTAPVQNAAAFIEIPQTTKKRPRVKERPTFARRFWVGISWLCTWFIPSFTLRWCGVADPVARQAWREKFTICFLIFLLSAIAIAFIFGLQIAFCPSSQLVTTAQVASHNSAGNQWVQVYSNAYDVTGYDTVNQDPSVFGADISIFPRVTDSMLQACSLAPSGAQVPWTPVNFPTVSSPDYGGRLFARITTQTPPINVVKRIGVALSEIKYHIYEFDAWIAIGSRIYNMTEFNIITKSAATADLFGATAQAIFVAKRGLVLSDSDVAQLSPDIIACMDNMFYIADIIDDSSDSCTAIATTMFVLLCITAFIQVAKFLSAIFAAADFKSYRKIQDNFEKHVIIQIPCYTEGESSLRKTIESCARLKYPDQKKLLMVVCDGMIRGAGESKPTPIIVMDILGVDRQISDVQPTAYWALGDGPKQLNYAKVYAGLYHLDGTLPGEAGYAVPYLIVAKCGRPDEKIKPGNRGKRDSQVLSFRFLQKVQNRVPLPLHPMEVEMYQRLITQCGVSAQQYSYMLMVDADTEVMETSLSHLVLQMEANARIMGITGETLISNRFQSYWTSIQVYEYYISHHLFKAFESLFGTVTCLPGCFTLWRLRTRDEGDPLLIHPKVVAQYSDNRIDTLHKRNLFHLGEDRYMTSIMIKTFPYMTTKYVARAKCLTIVPDSMKVLFSQRRRWINSTLHNLFELVMVKNLCGLLCFSMRFMVLIDLISTLLSPMLFVYLIYLIVITVTQKTDGLILNFILAAAIYGLQMLVFILEAKFHYLFWFFVNLLAMPIPFFILPLYCFWHQDDFSWGATRKIADQGGNKNDGGHGGGGAQDEDEEEYFDPACIPLTSGEELVKKDVSPSVYGTLMQTAMDEKGHQTYYGTTRTGASMSDSQQHLLMSHGVSTEFSTSTATLSGPRSAANPNAGLTTFVGLAGTMRARKNDTMKNNGIQMMSRSNSNTLSRSPSPTLPAVSRLSTQHPLASGGDSLAGSQRGSAYNLADLNASVASDLGGAHDVPVPVARTTKMVPPPAFTATADASRQDVPEQDGGLTYRSVRPAQESGGDSRSHSPSRLSEAPPLPTLPKPSIMSAASETPAPPMVAKRPPPARPDAAPMLANPPTPPVAAPKPTLQHQKPSLGGPKTE